MLGHRIFLTRPILRFFFFFLMPNAFSNSLFTPSVGLIAVVFADNIGINDPLLCLVREVTPELLDGLFVALS